VALDEFDVGYRDVQMLQMRNLEQETSHRSQEIAKIVKSINDLAQLFKELNVLVIEQGSALDRIDVNIENTLSHLKTGEKDLKAAERLQKSQRSLLCIALLTLTIMILLCILIFKWS
jgi:syntaxin 16